MKFNVGQKIKRKKYIVKVFSLHQHNLDFIEIWRLEMAKEKNANKIISLIQNDRILL